MPKNTYHADIDDTKNEGWVMKEILPNGSAVEVCAGANFNTEQAVIVAAALNQASCVGWKAAIMAVKIHIDKKVEESCPKKTKLSL